MCQDVLYLIPSQLIGPLIIIVRLAMAISVDVSTTATHSQEMVFANRRKKDHATDTTMRSFITGGPDDAKDTPKLSSLHLGGRKAAGQEEIELRGWKQSAGSGLSDQETTQHSKRYDEYA